MRRNDRTERIETEVDEVGEAPAPEPGAAPAGDPSCREAALLIPAPMSLPYRDAKQQLVDTFERAYVVALMREHGNNISAASRAADLSRRHLRDLLRKYGLWVAPDDAGNGDRD